MLLRDAQVRELMDDASQSPADVRRSLADLRRINAILGWRRYTVAQVARVVRSLGRRSFSLVDIASGSADMPLAIARWAERHDYTARIVATDLNPTMVEAARRQLQGVRGVTVERRDALHLSYPDASFDIALCTLALHHFPPDDVTRILSGMARVARHVLVFDLVRSRLAYLGAIALTHGLLMHPITRFDGPASVRRAYTASEMRFMARQAGLAGARVWVRVPFRLSLEASGVPSTTSTSAEAAARQWEERPV